MQSTKSLEEHQPMKCKMTLKVLDLSKNEDAQQYADALAAIGDRNPYYKLKFIKTFSTKIKEVFAFVSLNDSSEPVIMMPFHLRTIKTTDQTSKLYHDVMSTYGYSGPIFEKTVTIEDKNEFWQQVDAWYLENNVVTEFMRFNITDNHSEYTGVVIPSISIIKGKLVPIEDQWDVYDRKVRKNINKAKRENLEVKIYHKNITAKEVKEFYDIFEVTMARNNALDNYYYGKDSILSYVNSEPEDCVIITVYKDDLAVSTELLVLSENIMYSLIGGTIAEYFTFRPNELLKEYIIDWGFKNGFEYYAIGGGYGGDDGIYRYKKSFFPNDYIKFYTGRKIINKEVFYGLINGLKDMQNYQLTDEGYFPPYLNTN